MLLGLVRHGIAEDRGLAMEDADRRLTEKGKTRTQLAMRGLAEVSIDWSRVLTSPYVRAVETAEIAVQQLGLTVSLERLEALTPFGDPRIVFEALSEAPSRATLCFGHAPNLDRVIAASLGSSSSLTRLKKAGVAILETDPPRPGSSGLLIGLFPPAVLRAIS